MPRRAPAFGVVLLVLAAIGSGGWSYLQSPAGATVAADLGLEAFVVAPALGVGTSTAARP